MEGESFESQVDFLLDLVPDQASLQKANEIENEVVLFSEDGIKLSSEEMLYEFMGFMRNLPTMIKSEKNRLVNLVKDELQIDKIMNSSNRLNYMKLSKLGSGNHVISQLSRKIGQSLRILSPPTTKCLLCYENLSMNNPPSQIVVHGMNGPEVYSKYILRCKMCKLDRKAGYQTEDKKLRQDVYYHPERYNFIYS
jgi:hypothetical protein